MSRPRSHLFALVALAATAPFAAACSAADVAPDSDGGLVVDRDGSPLGDAAPGGGVGVDGGGARPDGPDGGVRPSDAGGGGSRDGGATDGGVRDAGTTPGRDAGTATPVPLGTPVSGDFHLGPVEIDRVSCGPYHRDVAQSIGPYLVGVGLNYNGNGQLCDACVKITTSMNRTLIARVVQTGVTNFPGDIDVSQAAYTALFVQDPRATPQHPRPMTWTVVKCPDATPMRYQYQTGAHQWWTSLWVRTPRVPLRSVEVQRGTETTWLGLTRANDGTWSQASGFGAGAFKLRVTGIDGQVRTQSFSGFVPGSLVEAAAQFD